MRTLDKRKLLFAGFIFLVSLVLLIHNIRKLNNKPVFDSNFDHSLEPENWIKESRDTSVIDVPEATGGNSGNR